MKFCISKNILFVCIVFGVVASKEMCCSTEKKEQPDAIKQSLLRNKSFASIRDSVSFVMSSLSNKGISFVKTRNYRRWRNIVVGLVAAGASVVLATWILNLLLVSPHKLVSTGQRALLQNHLLKAVEAGNYLAVRKIVAYIKTYYFIPWVLLSHLWKDPELREIYKNTYDLPYKFFKKSEGEMVAILFKRGDLRKMLPILRKFQEKAQEIGPRYGYNPGNKQKSPIRFFVETVVFLRKVSGVKKGLLNNIDPREALERIQLF
jgi:hypothetical protein